MGATLLSRQGLAEPKQDKEGATTALYEHFISAKCVGSTRARENERHAPIPNSRDDGEAAATTAKSIMGEFIAKAEYEPVNSDPGIAISEYVGLMRCISSV